MDNALGLTRTLRLSPFVPSHSPSSLPTYFRTSSSSSGDSQPEVPTTPCRREAVHSDAPLSSLVVLPNITVMLSDYDTADDLREKARHMKREEQEAYKWAKHTA